LSTMLPHTSRDGFNSTNEMISPRHNSETPGVKPGDQKVV
jgi:hypothetical protein